MKLPEQSKMNFFDRVKLSLNVLFSKQVIVSVKTKDNVYKTTALCFSKDEFKDYSNKLKSVLDADAGTDDLLKKNLPEGVKF
ncbi:MAG: hypothetical protein ACK4IZ_03355 [Flavobacterium sp.]|uniref:hypothetical protein n=1 Tax=Flavobacterium sp. TaxID=239 RepID=UPI0039193B4B